MTSKPVIFISCGQCTREEKQLGQSIRDLIHELRPDLEPYFAETQSSVHGLSQHILNALYKSAGFICVMHHRGDVSSKEKAHHITRGSVWIEQEIAVVSFMEHILKRSIPILFYKEADVGLEGIRSVLLLNPQVEFNSNEEILNDLRMKLPNFPAIPHLEYALHPIVGFECEFESEDLHLYQLVVNVNNNGSKKIDDFEIRVFFPREFIDQNITYGHKDYTKATKTHDCFILRSTEHQKYGLYPNDSLQFPINIPYFVNHTLFDSESMNKEVEIKIYSSHFSVIMEKRTMKEISNF